MYRPRRASVALFFTFFLLLGSLQWAAPIAAQTDPPTATTEATEAPPEEPTEVPPTEGVVPTETPAPEPTATTVPTEVVAPSVTPTGIVPTATTESSDFEAAAPIDGLYVYLQQCEDTSRVGVTDFFYYGEFAAADGEIGVNCIPVEQFINGAEVQVTLNSDTQSYVLPLNTNGQAHFGNDVEAGTYQVALLAGEEYMAVMQGLITLEPYSYSELAVIRYVTGGQTNADGGDAENTIQGTFIYCLDPSRVDQLDILIQGQLGGAGEAGECINPYSAQSSLILSGDSGNGRTYAGGPSVGTNIYFGNVEWGNEYYFTDFATGAQSALFNVDGSNGSNLLVTVYGYYAEEPPLLPVVEVQKLWCADDARAGESEFVIVNQGDIFGSAESTCIVGYLPTDDGVTMTLKTSPGGGIVAEVVVDGDSINEGFAAFPSIQPGTYTLTEEYEVDEATTTVVSDSFTVGYGDFTQIQVINYIEEDELEAPEDEGDAYFEGLLFYCESEVRAGLVDFVVSSDNNDDSQAPEGISAQGTSTCRFADYDEGLVTLNYFGNGGSLPTEPVDSFSALRNSSGYIQFGYILPGFYQLVFADSNFSDQVYRSETFPLYSASDSETSNSEFEILVYLDSVPATDLGVEKHICYDPARNGETDFYINDIPEESEFDSMSLSAAADLNCRYANRDEVEEFDMTLTNTATDQVIDAIYAGRPSYGYFFQAVPAGTYFLTETWGDTVVSSDEFTVDPAAGAPWIFVYNYTDEPIVQDQEGDPSVELNAFSCDTGTRSGEFDYFYYPEVPRGGQPTFAGAATENCRGANLGEFSFQLETLDESSETSAAAVYPLVQDPDLPLIYYFVDGDEDVIPAGTYVVRETVTGSVSAPFEFGGRSNLVEFYFFQAAPTPTPTDVPGQPTATPTDVPGDPTATTVPGEPTPTTITGTVVPGGDHDDDGTPDSEDPDFPGGVTTLPSTGQGTDHGSSSGLLILLALAAALLLGGAIRTGRITRR